jgi:hypothetical protein
MPHDLPRACQELAQAQEGVISRRQALECGVSSHVIDRRVRGGRWQALHHGVHSDARQVVPVPGVVIHRSARLSEAVHPSLLPPRTRIEETMLDLATQATTFDPALAIVCAGIQRLRSPPTGVAVT